MAPEYATSAFLRIFLLVLRHYPGLVAKCIGQSDSTCLSFVQNMILKRLSAVAIASGIGLLALATSIMPSAIAQTTDYQQVMENDDFSLWNSGESRGVAFNVWKRKGESGGGYYYFMWDGPYAGVEDRGNPEAVVFFDSSIARLDSEYLVDCYNDGSYGPTCLEPENKPVHYRYAGPCIFSWQIAADGRICGGRSAIAWPGQFE